MEIKETDAICLKAVDYKDNDKLITLYASGLGKITVCAKGCKKPKAKLKFAASIFCFGHYYLTKKGSMYTLTGCDLIDSFYDLALDPEKFYSAAVIVEILEKMGMEDDYNNNLLVTCLKCLKEIAYGKEETKKILFIYLREILSSLGYKCNAVTFMEYYNYLLHTHGVNINSLKELIKLN